ncbi:MAG: hypothetical protein ICV60_13565 [Pyrinomonadaceae bacterium]|nr:hypothetical protein [Pyrinomonadaceae bacterium]
MNCKNFEAIISDLAREQMLEAHTRESALLHIEECAECARMIEDERALTRGLRSLVTSMQVMEAPASLEATLRAKFREQVAAQNSPVVVQMPQRASAWQRWYPHAVAAAVLLMFAIGGASMLRLRQEQPAASQKNVAASSSKPENKAQPLNASIAPAATDEVEETAPTTIDKADAAGGGQRLSRSEVAAITGGNAPRRPGITSVRKSDIDRSGMSQTGGEIATDFMPVSYGDNLNDLDNGRIVRVEMPRSALAQFGLPVNMERANERIKADVLIGDDGMPRAIRFVR